MKTLAILLLSLFTALTVWINIKLYTENYTAQERREDIVHQLNFLETELKEQQLGPRMQEIFPEGNVFVNALYGLSWCELALNDQSSSNHLKKRAIKEAVYAFDQLNSIEARSIFDDSMLPENGIYYAGWNNYLLSKILRLDTNFRGHETYLKQYQQQCDVLAGLLRETGKTYFESYYAQSWPADMFLAMASLANYSNIVDHRYEPILTEWIKKVKQTVDPTFQLLPHKIDPKTESIVEGPRGCSIVLMLRMLAEIDPEYAQQQFDLFQKNFCEITLGLPSVREYPKGISGKGDVDSGPVIMGVGFAGTIVSIGTYNIFNCPELADQQYKTINAFGFETESGDEKKYIFGALPMADAFITWGRATAPGSFTTNDPAPSYWRLYFQLISACSMGVLWMFLFLPGMLRRLRAK